MQLATFRQNGSGLPDFSLYKIPKREKYTKLPRAIPKCPLNITKDRKMDQVSTNIPTSSRATPQKFPKFGFLFESKPSGNPEMVPELEVWIN
jgi:hypothetical protein